MAKLETLTDPFDGSTLNETLWTWDDQGSPEAVAYSVHDGAFYFDFAAGYAFYRAYLNADGSFDFSDSQVVVELLQPSSTNANLTFAVDVTGTRRWAMAVWWTGLAWELYCADGTNHTHNSYDWATQKFLRLRESSGTVYFESSATGGVGTWTTVWSSATGAPAPTDATFAIDVVDDDYQAGAFSAGVASVNVSQNVTAVPVLATLSCVGQTPLLQIEYPASADAYNGGWTNELGGSGDLYLSLVPAPSDYAQSPLNPSASVWVWRWASIADPVVYTEHGVLLTVRKDASGGQALQLRHQLRQSYVNEGSPGTLIREDTLSDLAATETDVVLALTEAEAAAISDYTALYSRVVADVMPGGGEDRRARVTAGKIKVPKPRGYKSQTAGPAALTLAAQTPAATGVRRLRPLSDTYNDQWTNELGSTENIRASIDEPNPDSSDYARSPVDPTTQVWVWRWDSSPDPGSSSGHTLRLRILKDFPAGPTLQLRHQLRQGYVNEGSPGTLIREDLFTDVGAVEAEVSVTLSGAEADAITDYSSLFSRVVAEVA